MVDVHVSLFISKCNKQIIDAINIYTSNTSMTHANKQDVLFQWK